MHALLGYSALIYGLLYGFRVAIADRFHPAKVLALIEREHVNVIMAAPTMIAALLDSQDFSRHKVSSLIYITMGQPRVLQTWCAGHGRRSDAPWSLPSERLRSAAPHSSRG